LDTENTYKNKNFHIKIDLNFFVYNTIISLFNKDSIQFLDISVLKVRYSHKFSDVAWQNKHVHEIVFKIGDIIIDGCVPESEQNIIIHGDRCKNYNFYD